MTDPQSESNFIEAFEVIEDSLAPKWREFISYLDSQEDQSLTQMDLMGIVKSSTQRIFTEELEFIPTQLGISLISFVGDDYPTRNMQSIDRIIDVYPWIFVMFDLNHDAESLVDLLSEIESEDQGKKERVQDIDKLGLLDQGRERHKNWIRKEGAVADLVRSLKFARSLMRDALFIKYLGDDVIGREKNEMIRESEDNLINDLASLLNRKLLRPEA